MKAVDQETCDRWPAHPVWCDAARSLGKSLRIFKSEVRELQNQNMPEPGRGRWTVELACRRQRGAYIWRCWA